MKDEGQLPQLVPCTSFQMRENECSKLIQEKAKLVDMDEIDYRLACYGLISEGRRTPAYLIE